MPNIPYINNVASMYRAIKAGQPFVNTMAGPISETTNLSGQVVGVLTGIMDNPSLITGPGDPNFNVLNEVVKILDAPYLGSGGFAQPTVFDGLYPPLKHLLSSNGDLSTVVQGMGIPLPGILNHTNTITESMPNILSAIGAKDNFNLTYLNAVEQCAEYFGIMGLLLGIGKQLLDAANSILQTFLQAINAAIAAGIQAIVNVVNQFLEPIKEAIKPLYDKLKQEVEQLEELTQDLLDQALAFTLSVITNPCIRAVVEAIGSDEVKSAFNTLSKIDSPDDIVPVIIQGG
jgi:phage-related protein